MIIGLIILFLCWAFLCLVRRDYAVAGLILLVPTYQIRFSIGFMPTTVLEWLIGILVLVTLIRALQKKETLVFPFLWLAVLFTFAGALATFTSVDRQAGLGLLKAYIVEPVLIYFVVVNTMKSPQSQKLLRYAFLALIAFVSVVAIFQAAHVVNVPEPYASQHPRRVTSIFSFPTAIGKLLAPLIAFCLAYCYFAFFSLKKNISTGWAYALPVLLGIASLFFSVNRGALIGVALATAFVVLLAKHFKTIAVVSLVVVIAAFAIPQANQYLAKVFDRQDTSTDVRVVMWKGTLRLIEAHPVFGAGLGGFPTLYNTYRDASHVELFPNPDQLILTLWAEMGLFGLIVFLIIMGVWVRICVGLLKDHHRYSDGWMVGAAGIAALIAFFAHGMLDTPYFKNDLAIIFWTLFGLLVIAKKYIATEKVS